MPFSLAQPVGTPVQGAVMPASPGQPVSTIVQVGSVVSELRQGTSIPSQNPVSAGPVESALVQQLTHRLREEQGPVESALVQQLTHRLREEQVARQKDATLWAEEWDELNRQLDLKTESNSDVQRVQAELMSTLKAKADQSEAQELMIQQIAGLQARNENLEQTLRKERNLTKNQLESAHNLHVQQLADTEKRFEIERTNWQQTQEDAQAKLNGFNEMKFEIDALRQHLSDVKSKRNSLQGHLQESSVKMLDAHLQFVNATNQLPGSTDCSSNVEKRLCDAAVFVANLEERFAEQTNELQKCRALIETHNGKLQEAGALKGQLTEAAQHIAQLEQRVAAEQECTNLLQEKLNALEAEKQAALQTQADKFQQEREQFAARLSSLESKQHVLQQDLDESDVRIGQADSVVDLTNLRHDLDELKRLGIDSSQRESALREQVQGLSDELAKSKQECSVLLDLIKLDVVSRSQLIAEKCGVAVQQKVSEEFAESRDGQSSFLQSYDSGSSPELDSPTSRQQKLSEDLALCRCECSDYFEQISALRSQLCANESASCAAEQYMREEMFERRLEISSLQERLNSEAALNIKFHKENSEHLVINRRLTEEFVENMGKNELVQVMRHELATRADELVNLEQCLKVSESKLTERNAHAQLEDLVQRKLAEELAIAKKDNLTLQQQLESSLSEFATASTEKTQAFAQVEACEAQLVVLREQAAELHQEILLRPQDADHFLGDSATVNGGSTQPGAAGFNNGGAEKPEFLPKRSLEIILEKKPEREREMARNSQQYGLRKASFSPVQRRPPSVRQRPGSKSPSGSRSSFGKSSAQGSSTERTRSGSSLNKSRPTSPSASPRRQDSTSRESSSKVVTSEVTPAGKSQELAPSKSAARLPGRHLWENSGDAFTPVSSPQLTSRLASPQLTSRLTSPQLTSRPSSTHHSPYSTQRRTLRSEVSSPATSDRGTELTGPAAVRAALQQVRDREGQKAADQMRSSRSADSVARAATLLNLRPPQASPAGQGIVAPVPAGSPSGSVRALRVPQVPNRPSPARSSAPRWL